MGSLRLLILAVLCITGHAVKGEADTDLTSSNDPKGNSKDPENEPIAAGENEGSEKLKRDVSIVGPIPTSYRGQATGQTTFDGIQAGDLQLPSVDTSGFRRDVQQPRPGAQGFGREELPGSAGSPGFGAFATDSAPDVYNFDGKEPLTYDGIVASDLMIPLPHVSRINTIQSPRPFAASSVGQQYRQTPMFRLQVPRQADSTLDGIFHGDLTVPTLSTVNQIFSRQSASESFGEPQPQLRDASLFQAETPAEKYNRLQEQYLATLEEYRNSLARFRQQLQKYTTLSRNNKLFNL